MSTLTIVHPTLKKVKRADPSAGGSSSTGPALETPTNKWQSTRLDVAPEPPAVPASPETRKMIYAAQQRSFSGKPKPPKLSAEEFVGAIADLFGEIELTPEEVDEELRGAGLDPAKLGARFKAFAKVCIEEQRAKMEAGAEGVGDDA